MTIMPRVLPPGVVATYYGDYRILETEKNVIPFELQRLSRGHYIHVGFFDNRTDALARTREPGT